MPPSPLTSPSGKNALRQANFGTGLSYVGYGESTNTVRVYIDYKSVKLGKSFTVSVKNLSDYAHGYVYDCTGQRTYTLENTPTYTPGGNHIPNGSFDLPYATDYFDGQITPRDGDGYMLFVPRSEVGWNYVRWNVNFESGKRYYLEYDAKAGKDADGNALSAATVNCAANVGGDRMLTGTIVSSSAWSHVEYLIPAELNMTEWFGIYSNPEGGKSISYFLDNVSLKEAFTATFTRTGRRNRRRDLHASGRKRTRHADACGRLCLVGRHKHLSARRKLCNTCQSRFLHGRSGIACSFGKAFHAHKRPNGYPLQGIGFGKNALLLRRIRLACHARHIAFRRQPCRPKTSPRMPLSKWPSAKLIKKAVSTMFPA